MFFILLFLILIVVLVLNSKLQVRISNLDISTDREEKIKKDFNIYSEIIIFNKIKIFKINAKKLQSKKVNLNTALEKVKEIERNINKRGLNKNTIESIKDLILEISETNLKVELGTEDAALTAILVGVTAGILGIILKRQKFEVIPIYQDKNVLKIKLDGIFRLNLIHYIYKTILKGRGKNERKSSDRRSYAYSNE